jgi:hypothetical protein
MLSSYTKFSIFNFQFSIKSKIFNFQNLFILLLTSYFLYLIHPALLGQLGGTFKQRELPADYILLKNKLSIDTNFYRSLWIPEKQRYGFISLTHPGIYAQDIFYKHDVTEIIRTLKNPRTSDLLRDASIKYVIVPFDSEKEIFIKDRKYNENVYKQTVKELDGVKWLKKVDGFGRIAVYEVADPKDHFWSPSTSLRIEYRSINSTKYSVSIKNAKRGDELVFSESFDSSWRAMQGGKKLAPSPYNLSPHIRLNSFVLPEDGDYTLEVYYAPQRLVDIGIWISLASLALILMSLLWLKKKA